MHYRHIILVFIIIFASILCTSVALADTELFSNNADTILSSAAADSDTIIYVQDATGFQSPGAGEFQRIILADGVDYEIVTLTGVSGSALTVTREQEGTTAPALWAAGTRVLANFTAATLGNFCQEADTSSFCGADPDLATLAVPASTTISTFAATFTDDADAAAVRTTLDVDQAGTDNSTDVTLGGTGSYCSLAGQALTCNLIDLSSEITGTLGAANGGTGQTSLGAVSLEDFGNGCTLGQIIDSDGAGGSDCLDFSGSLVYEATDCTALSGYVQGNSCWDATTNTLYVCESANCDGSGWVAATAAGDGVGYDTIQDNGSSETQRANLNLISGTGATVSCADNAGSSRTDCTISATGGLTISEQTITTSDLSASAGNHYRLDIDGMTAQRSLILPASCTDEEVIEWELTTDAPATIGYGLVLEGDTGVEVCVSGSCATAAEVTRYLVNGESGRAVCDSGGAWVVSRGDDGRVHCNGTMELSADITTNTPGVAKLVTLDSVDNQICGWADTSTNNGFVLRRDGKIQCSGSVAPYNPVADAETYGANILLDSTIVSRHYLKSAVNSTHYTASVSSKIISGSVGEAIQLEFYATDTDDGASSADHSTYLSCAEIL